MRTSFVLFALGVSALPLAAVEACGSSKVTPTEGLPAPLVPQNVDSGVAADATESSSSFYGSVRIAHLVPGLGPVAICRAASAISPVWQTVIPAGGFPTGDGEGGVRDGANEAVSESGAGGERAEAAPPDAPTDGGPSVFLTPLTLSAYVSLPSGTFQVGVVADTAGSCDTPAYSQPVTLEPGKKVTLALMQVVPAATPPSPEAGGPDAADAAEGGDAGGGGVLYAFIPFIDEPAASSTRHAVTRFINAVAPEGDAAVAALKVSVLPGATSTPEPLASLVAPRSVSAPSATAPVVDPLGYHTGRDPGSPLAFRISVWDSETALAWTGPDVPGLITVPSVHTGFILNGGAPSTYSVLWCDDLFQTSTVFPCALIR